MSEKHHSDGPVVIKKYANRRLYNTQTSSYVTLDHLAQMVKEGTEFEVHDARTALGHAYGGGSQFFAMWVVGAGKPSR